MPDEGWGLPVVSRRRSCPRRHSRQAQTRVCRVEGGGAVECTSAGARRLIFGNAELGESLCGRLVVHPPQDRAHGLGRAGSAG